MHDSADHAKVSLRPGNGEPNCNADLTELDFGDVYVNEKATVRPLILENHGPNPVSVILTFSCNESSQSLCQVEVYFQLENENLRLYGTRTSLYNKLFNCTDYVDRVLLPGAEPGTGTAATQEIVAVFIPSFPKTVDQSLTPELSLDRLRAHKLKDVTGFAKIKGTLSLAVENERFTRIPHMNYVCMYMYRYYTPTTIY